MSRTKKVLIYEDFGSIRNILLNQLEKAGFEIYEAHTLSEALGYLNGVTLDLFITDNDMADNSALKIIKHMRDTTSYLFTPIILLITGKKEQYLEQLSDYNIAMYFSKPFDIGKFNDILKRFTR